MSSLICANVHFLLYRECNWRCSQYQSHTTYSFTVLPRLCLCNIFGATSAELLEVSPLFDQSLCDRHLYVCRCMSNCTSTHVSFQMLVSDQTLPMPSAHLSRPPVATDVANERTLPSCCPVDAMEQLMPRGSSDLASNFFSLTSKPPVPLDLPCQIHQSTWRLSSLAAFAPPAPCLGSLPDQWPRPQCPSRSPSPADSSRLRLGNSPACDWDQPV